MSDQKRPGEVNWIVPVPDDDPRGEKCFIAACRGNRDIARMLNYFLFAASKEVESKKADRASKCITIKRNTDTIADYLRISQKTAIRYIHYLTAWELVISHGYYHTYDVCHHKVAEVMKNPPAPEWPKLRGKHVKREDCTDGKSTIHEKDERIDFLEQQIVNLQSRMVDLQSWIVDLQTGMVNLQSVQSSKGTSQAVREAVFDPLIITNESLMIGNDKGTLVASAIAPSTPASLSALSAQIDAMEIDMSERAYRSGIIDKAALEQTYQDVEARRYGQAVDSYSQQPSDWLSEEGEIADENNSHLSTEGVDNFEDDGDAPTLTRIPIIPKVKEQTDVAHTLATDTDPAGDPGNGVCVRHETGGTEPDTQGEIADAQQPAAHPRAAPALDRAHDGPLSGARAHDLDNREIDTSLAQHTSDAETAAPLPPDAATPAASEVPPAPVKSKRGKAEKPARPAKPPEPTLEETLSDDELLCYHEWCSLFKVSVPLQPATAKAAKQLAEPCAVWAGLLETTRADVLKQMRSWCFANDKKGWYRGKGVKLYDLAREFEGWQSDMQQQLDERNRYSKGDVAIEDEKPDYLRPDGTTDYVKYVMWKARHPDYISGAVANA